MSEQKPRQSVLNKQAKAHRDATIGRLMAANPLIKDLLTDKLNDQLAISRQRLEDGTELSESAMRFLQGNIQAYKDMLSVVALTQ